MRKHNSIHKLLSLILGIVLTAALALTGCSGTPAETTAPTAPPAEKQILGEGTKVFEFTVVDKDGSNHIFEIHTDAEMVGQALLDLELISGEEGPYGLYVKSVLDQVLDYDTDKMYWSFYVNGEYGMTGVDLTPITEGESYMFKAESA